MKKQWMICWENEITGERGWEIVNYEDELEQKIKELDDIGIAEIDLFFFDMGNQLI